MNHAHVIKRSNNLPIIIDGIGPTRVCVTEERQLVLATSGGQNAKLCIRVTQHTDNIALVVDAQTSVVIDWVTQINKTKLQLRTQWRCNYGQYR